MYSNTYTHDGPSHELSPEEERCMKQVTDAVLFQMHHSRQGTGSLYSSGAPETSGLAEHAAKAAWAHKKTIAKVAHTALLLNPETRGVTKVADKLRHKAEKLAAAHPEAADAAKAAAEATVHKLTQKLAKHTIESRLQ
jgi:hypothetical protein